MSIRLAYILSLLVLGCAPRQDPNWERCRTEFAPSTKAEFCAACGKVVADSSIEAFKQGAAAQLKIYDCGGEREAAATLRSQQIAQKAANEKRRVQEAKEAKKRRLDEYFEKRKKNLRYYVHGVTADCAGINQIAKRPKQVFFQDRTPDQDMDKALDEQFGYRTSSRAIQSVANGLGCTVSNEICCPASIKDDLTWEEFQPRDEAREERIKWWKDRMDPATVR